MNIISIFLILSHLETCLSIDGVALKGQEFRWVDESGDLGNTSSCVYTDTPTHFISQKIPFPGS